MLVLDFFASTVYLPVAFMLVMTAGFAGAILLFLGLAAWELHPRRARPQPVRVDGPS